MFGFLRKNIVVFEQKEKSLQEILIDFHSFYCKNADTIHGLSYPTRPYIPAIKNVIFNKDIPINSNTVINMDLNLSERIVSLILIFKEPNFSKELANIKISKYYSSDKIDIERFNLVKEFENGPLKSFMNEKLVLFQKELEKVVEEKDQAITEILNKSFTR